ncbi:helix-turn-helix domain-containing protein [Paenibacillus alkalitolerans]|uniref:DNA-binding response regulator n=1 Tax=Paenibacillus alkalitolerans TaxID=2799335 RepID=UPI0018F38686|nr:DNA-binding response regulator [Paenibacillus alkalitolerans]
MNKEQVEQFEKAHKEWLESHKRRRTGDRLKRLEEGHDYLEKLFLKNIWWPAFTSFDDLHPEYEVRDYNDGKRYLDHAYKPLSTKLVLEADGFNPHIRDVDRWVHADNLLRDSHLIADGWTVVHYSSDVIKYRPRQAQQLLRQIVWGREGKHEGAKLSLKEKELLRFARMKGAPIAPVEISAYLDVSKNTTVRILKELLDKQLVKPVDAGKLRIRYYELTRMGREIIL